MIQSRHHLGRLPWWLQDPPSSPEAGRPSSEAPPRWSPRAHPFRPARTARRAGTRSTKHGLVQPKCRTLINDMGLKHQVEIAKNGGVPTLPELVEGNIFMKPLFRCQKQCFLKQWFSQMVFFKQIHGMLLGCISTNVLIYRLYPHACWMIFHIWVGHGWSKNGVHPKIHVVSQHLPCSNWNFR